jgi:TrmH family RNA methyltransferase
VTRLTSTKNPLLQKVRRAAREGRPTEEGLVTAEGPHLLEEAQRGSWETVQVFVTAAAMERHRELLGRVEAEVIDVAPQALASVASTDTTQGILTLLRPRNWSWQDLGGKLVRLLVLDGIQDPGNAGTMVRSAEAFGATGVVLLAGCVRVANGKFLRASAGSIFRIPFLEGEEPADFLAHAGESFRVPVYALDIGGDYTLTKVDLANGWALAVGSEGAGVSPEVRAGAMGLAIPTSRVESLNAAVAASVALFEAARQRATR